MLDELAGFRGRAEYHGARLGAETSALVVPAELGVHAERYIATDVGELREIAVHDAVYV